MLERLAMGRIPDVAHTAHRDDHGSLYFEHCVTTEGFDGAYTILYHMAPPHAQSRATTGPLGESSELEAVPPLAKRHFRTATSIVAGDTIGSTRTLFVAPSVSVATSTPTESDRAYVLESDEDVLYFVQGGTGTLRTSLGDVAFGPFDYVYVPRGILHRFELGSGASHRFLRLGFPRGLRLRASHRNRVGQLRMDAPIAHRDFRKPTFAGPVDEGIRRILARRRGSVQAFEMAESPLDVVGWDGTSYPWALPIEKFRPRVGSSHLPPDVHGTFESDGVLVSSFVPRPLDFGPNAIPCPYPHSSVDCDELLYYASGDFISRRGIEVGSVTLHPAGIPHGPVPGAYEASIGRTQVDEIAVMLDVFGVLRATSHALAMEDPSYHDSYARRDE